MKHLLNKLTVSLFVTCVALPSIYARAPILEVPTAAESYSAMPETLIHDVKQPQSNPLEPLKRLSDIETQTMLLGVTMQDEHTQYKRQYKILIGEYLALKAKFDALSESEKASRLENALLKIEQQKYQDEKKSTWQRLKNWLFNLDVTKVTTTVITGLITVISTLLIILL